MCPHQCRRSYGAHDFNIVNAVAFNVEHMTRARHEEQREPSRVARERFVIAGDGTDDRAACGSCELDMQDVLGTEILAAPQTSW